MSEIQDPNELWKKLFQIPPDCHGYGEDRCHPCCMECKYLPECYLLWKRGKEYCKVRNNGQWCSVAYRAYHQFKTGKRLAKN